MSAHHCLGRIIVLNGTSSSGKTSLASELQRIAPDLQLLHLQLDAFRAMEPPGYWSAEYREQAPLRVEALCRAMNAATATYARHGQNVMVDHVLTWTAWNFLLEDLVGHQLLLVKVECSLKELERRELKRKDREQGLAKSQLATVHAGKRYDFEVNTTSRHAAELALELATWLRSSPPLVHIQVHNTRVMRPNP
jgi:chloramphenicol 3-O phosphotransferase